MDGSPEVFHIRDRRSLIAADVRNAAGVICRFLENGSVFSLMHRGILINQVLGSPIDGSLANIYLRRHHRDSISITPLLGPAAAGEFSYADDHVSWTGTWDGLDYTCMLRLAVDQAAWFWTVRVHNATDRPQALDVVFSQDLGIATEEAVRTNELYASQYIDHTVLLDATFGYLLCSRQNQSQGNTHPWILHGCIDGATGYLTDGFQFFGCRYKETGVPAALESAAFANVNYQYECALPTLKTRVYEVPSHSAQEVTFFAVYEEDHPPATSGRDLQKAEAAVAAVGRLADIPDGRDAVTVLPRSASYFANAPGFVTLDLTAQELVRYFGASRRHEEMQGENLLSFFYGSGQHVVLRAKELLVERPHGHIMRSGREQLPSEDMLSTTAWMYGVFNSQVTIGNTVHNKVLSISRNPLNVLKSSGQRVLVKRPHGYAVLGLPSAFEMGFNSARWIYRGVDAVIVVKAWTSPDDPACFLEISVEGDEGIEFLISHNVVLGDAEFGAGGTVDVDTAHQRVVLLPAVQEPLARKYPESRFYIVSRDWDQIERAGGDGLLFADGRDRDYGYVVVKTKPTTRFSLAITGSVLQAQRATDLAEKFARWLPGYETVLQESGASWGTLCGYATLTSGTHASEIAGLDDTLRWCAHDAMVHFTIPHGLEQYSGAAWGVRDVCQGPVEFLRATRSFAAMRELLKVVYSHQFAQTGDWPQWFMFDRFQDTPSPDSHADIVVWPIKAICDYVEATDDLAVLEVETAFTDYQTRLPTVEASTLFGHTLRQIERLEQACIPGTSLATYGYGDWEDTLQPADAAMREQLVSSWTVELIYQTLKRYQTICERAGRAETAARLGDLCDRVRADFNLHLVKDGVVAGLVHFGAGGVEYLLHPTDEKTGVQYRLLPMTRGMISGIFSPKQMRDHLAIIRDHLTFPDGVRLMDRPMAYHGGEERYFKRAETAANFGREIGLQYVHAHIRYVEAMAEIGRPEEVYRGLLTITPIGISDVVPCALPRQSNAYFSSSDAAFLDRYEAVRDFEKIREGRVGVKGGWRIYSSGPGIFFGQVIMSFLGLRERFSDILLDPVIPKQLDGLAFDFQYAGKRVRYLYHIHGEGFSPREVVVNGTSIRGTRYAENPYRRGGMLISKTVFTQALNSDHNLVEISI
jgi:cellobiose phosphorylase